MKTGFARLAALLWLCALLLCPSSLSGREPFLILYTNDIHAADGPISFAQIAQYKRDRQKETPHVLLADAGDAIQGAPLGSLTRGAAIVRLMNAAGYDFAVPGNHEFDYGMDRFLSLARRSSGGYFSANLTDLRTGRTVLPPYKLFPWEDTKVALVGVTTPASLTSSTPAFFQDGVRHFLYSFQEDRSGAALYEAVQSAVDQARREGASHVILVAHLGAHHVSLPWSSPAVVRHTTGIDAVIDGHSHEVIPCLYEKNAAGQPVPITQTGTKLARLGELTLRDDGTVSTRLLGQLNRADPAVADALRKEQRRLAPLLQRPVGQSAVSLVTADPGSGARLVRSGETNLGDFAADAYCIVLGADVGLSNGGGLRQSLSPGAVTMEDLLTAFPFQNQCALVRVTGQQLLDALEMGASRFPAEFGGFLQVSGLSYTIDPSIPSSVVTDDKGVFLRVGGPYRVRDVLVGGRPLRLDASYIVGGTAYLLTNGGDGMAMLQQGTPLPLEAQSEVSVIARYITGPLRGSIPASYADPRGSGRIRILPVSHEKT